MAKRRKKSNKTLYIVLGVVVIAIIVLVAGKSAGFIGKQQEIEVSVSAVEKTFIIEKVSASGTVLPVNEVRLSPDVSGEIIELNVEEGDSVIAGTLLAKIRPDNFINALERAEANLNQVKANEASALANLARAQATHDRLEIEYERSKSLYDEKVISDSDWQLAEQNYKVAQNDLKSAEQNLQAAKFIVASSRANVDDAKENLRLTSVLAPVSGTISKLSVEQGERVVGTQQMAGTEMMRIADLHKMEVRVDVNENDIIRISLGDTAEIDVDSYSYLEKQFKGVVTQIANTAKDRISADAVTEFEVRIRILNSSYRDLIEEGNRTPFRPGMTASVDVITERKEDILTVPLASVTTRSLSDFKSDSTDNDVKFASSEGDSEDDDEKKEVVFVYEDGKVKLVLVKTGISDYDNIQILEGLEEGDKVVSGPFLAVSRRLNDGDAVVTDEEEDSDSSARKKESSEESSDSDDDDS